MEFCVLGSVDVSSAGEPLPLGGPRQRALLAYLLLNGHEVVSAERLIDELWYDPPAGGVQTVHTQVSRLRRALGGRIVTTGNGYELHVEPGELDLDRFRSLLAEAGEAEQPTERARLLREADALWHGEPLHGLEAPFVAAEARALEELRLVAVEERIDADLEACRHAALVAELSALVARHPLRERLRGQLILALYRSGRQAEALAAFQDARRMLDEELGLEPSTKLRELELAILRHDPDLEPPAATPGQAAETKVPVGEGSIWRPRRRILVAAGFIMLASAGTATGLSLDPDLDFSKGRTTTTSVAVAVPPAHTQPVAVIRTTTRAASSTRTSPHRRRRPRPTPTAAPPPARVVETTTVAITTAALAPPKTTPVEHPVQAHHANRTHRVAPAAPRTTTAPKHAAAPKNTTTKTPTTSTVTVADRFDGAAINGAVWDQFKNGDGWTLAQRGGRLEFNFLPGTIPGGATNTYGGELATHCKFSGDFDARVSYNLAAWPPANGVSVSLWAFFAPVFAPSDYAWRAWRASTTQAEQYGSYTGPGLSASYAVADSSGELRLARRHGTVTTYFMHNGNWVALTSGTNTNLAAIAIGAASEPGGTFGGQQVLVDLDDFQVTAAKSVC